MKTLKIKKIGDKIEYWELVRDGVWKPTIINDKDEFDKIYIFEEK